MDETKIKDSALRAQNSLSKIMSYFVFTIWLVTGCTIGNHGTLVAKYTTTATATVLDIYSLGFQFRPNRIDFGVTLGYRHASYILSKTTNMNDPHGSTWHWFNHPWPVGDLIARGSSSVGIEMQATDEVGRLTVGYIDQLITIGPIADESKVVQLYYNRKRPEDTYLTLVEGDSDR